MIGIIIMQAVLMVAFIFLCAFIVNLSYEMKEFVSLLDTRTHEKVCISSADERANTPDEREENVPEQEEVAQIADELSDAELARLERDYSFDERIRRMKEELAKEQVIMKRGTIAEETHPLVKNLPHNIIADTRNEIPDVEYTD